MLAVLLIRLRVFVMRLSLFDCNYDWDLRFRNNDSRYLDAAEIRKYYCKWDDKAIRSHAIYLSSFGHWCGVGIRLWVLNEIQCSNIVLAVACAKH